MVIKKLAQPAQPKRNSYYLNGLKHKTKLPTTTSLRRRRFFLRLLVEI